MPVKVIQVNPTVDFSTLLFSFEGPSLEVEVFVLYTLKKMNG
jgi:hypothetical protein